MMDSDLKYSSVDLIGYSSSLSHNNMKRLDPKMPHSSAISFLMIRSVVGVDLLRGLLDLLRGLLDLLRGLFSGSM